MSDPLSNNDDRPSFIAATVESMRDQIATKSDIARLESKIEVEFTAVRSDIKQVLLRLDSIERALNAPLGQFVLDQPESVSDEGRP